MIGGSGEEKETERLVCQREERLNEMERWWKEEEMKKRGGKEEEENTVIAMLH